MRNGLAENKEEKTVFKVKGKGLKRENGWQGSMKQLGGLGRSGCRQGTGCLRTANAMWGQAGPSRPEDSK